MPNPNQQPDPSNRFTDQESSTLGRFASQQSGLGTTVGEGNTQATTLPTVERTVPTLVLEDRFASDALQVAFNRDEALARWYQANKPKDKN